jgi:hypothetical protein
MMTQLTMAVAEAQMSMFGPLSAPLEQNKGADEDNSNPKPNKSRPNTGQDGSRPQTGDNKRPGTAQSKGTSGGDKEEEDEQGMLAQAWSYVSGFFLGGDDDEDRITKFTEVVPTDDHLTLDKPWVLPDAKGLEVHKVIPDVFYMRPMKEVSEYCRYMSRVWNISTMTADFFLHQPVMHTDVATPSQYISSPKERRHRCNISA